MAVSTTIVPEPLGISPSREPLRPRTASPLAVTSPLSAIIKQVRRKDSFLERADSSEEYPSSHDSIYEAFYFSGTTSEDSGSRIERAGIEMGNLSRPFPTTSPKPIVGNDENIKRAKSASEPPLPSVTNLDIGEIQFLYGHGTVLQTITEQHSCGTISTLARRRSADNFDHSLILGHRDSLLLLGPRRKLSFSMDDLALIKRSYHEACSTIEYEARKQLQIPEVYAQPKSPIMAPPNRSPTPPGMPSWTASQNQFGLTQTRRGHQQQQQQQQPQQQQQSNQPQKKSRFQRFFHLSNSSYTMIAGGSMPNTQFSSSTMPVRGRMAPRFRPPRSAYGPIDQHPFTRAPIAKVNEGSGPNHVRAIRNALTSPPTTCTPPNQPESRIPKPKRNRLGLRVRFTPSATARDSEMINVQSAMEATVQTALHPLSPLPTPSSPDGTNRNQNHNSTQTYGIKKPCPHQKPKSKPKPAQTQSQHPLANSTNIINHSTNSLTINLVSIPPSTEYLLPPNTCSISQPPQTNPNSASTSTNPNPYGNENQNDHSPLKRLNCPSFAASSRRGSMEALDMSIFEPIATVHSYSSTTHIMSGALRTPSPSVSPGPESFREGEGQENDVEEGARNGEAKWCWKCKAQSAKGMVGGWWRKCEDGFYGGCCGLFDEEDGEREGGSGEGMRDLRYGGLSFGASLGARRGVWDGTPCGVL